MSPAILRMPVTVSPLSPAIEFFDCVGVSPYSAASHLRVCTHVIEQRDPQSKVFMEREGRMFMMTKRVASVFESDIWIHKDCLKYVGADANFQWINGLSWVLISEYSARKFLSMTADYEATMREMQQGEQTHSPLFVNALEDHWGLNEVDWDDFHAVDQFEEEVQRGTSPILFDEEI